MSGFIATSEQADLKTKQSRQLLRQQVRQQRQQLTLAQQDAAAISLLARFCDHKKIQAATSIALYLSNDGEVNTQQLIDWCWQQGKNVYLPVVHPFSAGHLLFLHYQPHTPLVKNRFGIGEPKLDVRNVILPTQIDIICTPLVAFDDTGARLGMGGGFYDRTLQHWYQHFQANKKSKPYPIGLAHDCQRVTAIASEHWDIPLPEIITPSKHFSFKLKPQL
ncbi:5-formyltetrahydrofolate cyclo-ligase [Colwellia chukchiensis]|uniref:5-formyltetrahydrofolate cyclo-ligase n=1 Tax=Colwellia chukchiensis TaxID=641665 RepID=A0A1H7HBH2_9GAMM|nr:5-formyltetrahydrofolate cyclo-ligase [Colwellia chukchiensis]SEK47624.1 5-formyltetrahydrofolate cyclo-ligase [Colwellia chukchiensis]